MLQIPLHNGDVLQIILFAYANPIKARSWLQKEMVRGQVVWEDFLIQARI